MVSISCVKVRGPGDAGKRYYTLTEGFGACVKVRGPGDVDLRLGIRVMDNLEACGFCLMCEGKGTRIC